MYWNENQRYGVRSAVGLLRIYWGKTVRNVKRVALMMYPIHAVLPNFNLTLIEAYIKRTYNSQTGACLLRREVWG